MHGAAVACISPAGKLLERIAVPAKHPTMVAFGGPQLDQLYVTSSSKLLLPEERALRPQAGALFRIDGLAARGLPEPRFGAEPVGNSAAPHANGTAAHGTMATL